MFHGVTQNIGGTFLETRCSCRQNSNSDGFNKTKSFSGLW